MHICGPSIPYCFLYPPSSPRLLEEMPPIVRQKLFHVWADRCVALFVCPCFCVVTADVLNSLIHAFSPQQLTWHIESFSMPNTCVYEMLALDVQEPMLYETQGQLGSFDPPIKTKLALSCLLILLACPKWMCWIITCLHMCHQHVAIIMMGWQNSANCQLV